MPVPTHAWDCETSIWETTCPDCGDIVYFFSCSCGSKVYFNLPGPPWPEHAASCLPYKIRVLASTTNLTGAQIRQMVLKYAQANNLPLNQRVQQVLSSLPSFRSGGISLIAVAPSRSAQGLVTGTVTTINPSVNFFNRLKLPDNKMSRGLLGKLVQDAYDEVVLRTSPDGFRQSLEYVVFVPSHEVKAARIIQRCRASVKLVFHQLIGGQKMWLGQSLQRLHNSRRS